jgi:hypothetical protein
VQPERFWSALSFFSPIDDFQPDPMIEDDAQLGQRRILHPPGGLVNRIENPGTGSVYQRRNPHNALLLRYRNPVTVSFE